MTTMPNSEFAKRMMLLARSAEEFRPVATYDSDGDCIEFFAKPDPFYAERVDDLVTVYYSQETHEVIGSLIKRVSTFCKAMLERIPGFCIEIRAGRVKVEHIFLARMWTESLDADDLITLTYRKLAEVADDADVEVDADELCPA